MATTKQIGQPGMMLPERLESRIEREPMSGCWLWTGSVNGNGYGRISVSPGHRTVLAHRAVFVSSGGMFLPGRWILDHLCRVKCCVNPAHLRPVTDRENILAPGSLSPSKANADKVACGCGAAFVADPRRPGRRRGAGCVRRRERAYALAHPEQGRQAVRRYYANHAEEIRERD